MIKATPLINAFNAGEICPTIDVRSDIEKYFHGCRTLQNFIPLVEGPVDRMPGLYYVGMTKRSFNARVETESSSLSLSVSAATESLSTSATPSRSVSPSPSTSGPGMPLPVSAYAMDTLAPDGGSYYFHGAITPSFNLYAGEKRYYMVDTFGYTGSYATLFTMWVKGFNNSDYLAFSYMVLNRVTNEILVPEKRIYQNRSLQLTVDRPDLTQVKYIFGLRNAGPGTCTGEIFWTW